MRRHQSAFLLVITLYSMMVSSGLPLRGQSGPDTDPPVIHVLESGSDLADGALFRRAVQPVVQVTDASSVTVDTTIDGVPFTAGSTVSGEGQHVLAVSATDAAENTASASVHFTIDTVAPSFVTVLPVSGSLISAAQVTLSGELDGAVSLTVGGQAANLVGGQWSAGPYTLSEGERTWTLTATDLAGNSATRTHRIVRDSTLPAVAIGQPAEGAVRNATPIQVVGTASDAHLEGVTVNGTAATLAGTTWVAANVPLAEGQTQLVVEARDAAGNTRTVQRAVVLDTQAPAVAITDPATGTVVPGATLAVGGTASDPHLDRVEVNGVRATLANGAWTVTVPLTEGANDLVARAWDTLGWNAADTVSVIRDSQAPAIHIEQPADGAYLNAQSVGVSGTVEQEAGLTVTVNGVAATLSGGAFTAAAVPLVEGENRLIARVTDHLGNQGAHTELVYRDTVAPRFVTSEPAGGALALPLEAEIDVTFSEPLRTPLAAGAWRLETAAGQAIAAQAVVSGSVVTVRPQAALPSHTQIRVALTAGLVDRAGNALANPSTLSFTTVDRDAPPAPVLAAAPAAFLCAPRLALSGTAEPDSVVQATGGAGSASDRAGADGAFALTVDLLPEALNHLELVARDSDGNRSAPLAVDVVHDCTPPRVTGAGLTGATITVSFSERIAAASLSGAVTVRSAAGAVAGTTAPAAGGSSAVFTPGASLPSGALSVEVSQAVRDLAGNPLAFPYSGVLGSGVTESFVAGRVIDNATGRPLAGAVVAVVTSGGTVNPEPQPEQTTAADGRFRIPVAPGTHTLLIARHGWTPVLRAATAAAASGTDVFDPRLTPSAAAVAVQTAGGAVTGSGGLSLTIPAGALAAPAQVSVTPLEEQGLPALLPYGWSPRGAVWIDLGGAALGSAATLTLPVDAPDGTAVALARLDLATLQWHTVAIGTAAGGRVTLPVSEEGGYAAVEADAGGSAPPAAIAGTVLGSSPAPTGSEVTAAVLAFNPATVLPSQRSLVTVDYTVTGEPPSGVPLTLTVREELTLLGGAVQHQSPYEADLVMYRAPGAAASPRSRFGLRPSAEAQTAPLEMGAEDVTVDHYAGESVRGNVIGPVGGTVASPEGDRIDVPASALSEPTAVSLARRAAADLPHPVPAGTAFLGLLDLDLSGSELAAAAALTLELGSAPASGQTGLLFQVVELGGGSFYRPVAALAPTATGWTTAAIDPQDLPWPGVREGGLYLFARLTAGLGYLRGTVFDVDGAPLARALVTSPALPWIQLADSGARVGRYVLPAPAGSLAVTAENRETANSVTASTAIPAADARVDLDLLIRVTGPRVLEVVPANGATNVLPGVEPTVRFSEPVDAATAASGVLLYDGAALVPTHLDVQGALVRVRPQATLRPAASYELRINTAVRDLQGHRLDDAVTSTFATQASQVNSQLDLSRIHLIEPVGGNARVLGRPGAVPAGTVLVAEKTTGTSVTVTVTAGSDGGFDLQIPATLADTILLHVVLQGQNEIIVELTPFLTADGHGAHVKENRAATFSTLDGVTVKIAEGTFLDPTVVRVDPVARETVRAPVPSDLPIVAAFQLDFGGVEAQKPLQISMPTPAGVTHDELLLSRVYNILGQDYWMLYDLMRRSNGRITTELLPDETAEGSGLPQAVAQLASLSPGVAPGVPPGTPRQIHAGSRRGDGKEYLPGSANPGLYIVMEDTTFLDFVAFPFVSGMFAYFLQIGIDGCIASINQSVERLLTHDAVLMPTRRGLPFTIIGRDLSTGYKFFERTYDPPASGEITPLPPDNFGDRQPPNPVSGSPLRFYVVVPTGSTTEDLDRGIHIHVQRDPTAFQASLTLTGDPGAVQKQVQLRLLGLDDAKNTPVRSADNGSFTLAETVTPGNRYILAIGGIVPVAASLDIEFSEALPDGFPDIDVLDSRGQSIQPRLDAVGTNQTLRISAPFGWTVGQTYTLRLKPTLHDPRGNAWNRQLDLEIKVEQSEVLNTLILPSVRDVARLGSLLFVAADAQGLVVVDASDPAHLRNLIPGNLAFPFPLADPVTAVTVDPHGRVLVAGGGLHGFGQLKIFDPLALDPAAIAANPNDPQVRYAAFKGSTILSDPLGANPGTSLPEGRPRHVTVLSDDVTSRWRIGVDPPPASVTLTPAQPPAGGGEYTVTVEANDATSHLPVTFRDVSRGRWSRVDAGSGGSYHISLRVRAGDRVELLRNTSTIAYVATQGVGVQVVNVDAFYNETPEDPNTPSPESDVMGTYTGYEDPNLTVCGQPVSDIGSALLDLGTLFDRDEPAHPLTVVGLLGLRGLMFLDSQLSDRAHLSFFNDVCAQVAGSTLATGMEVVEDYPFDFNRNGKLEAAEYHDLIVVTHRTQGVLIFDAQDRDNVALIGWVRLPGGQAAGVSVDRDRRRLYVSAYGGGIYVIDFDRLPSILPQDANLDGTDDRVLETIALNGNTNSAVFLLPELGIAYAGGLDRGLTSIAVGAPSLAAVTAERETATTGHPDRPRWRTLRRLAPLGVPTAPESPAQGAPDLQASFRVLASLPGVAGDQVRLDVVSLGPGGMPIPGAGDADAIADLPRAALEGADHGVILHREADNRWEDGYQLYLSEEIAAIADLRAARHYQRTPAETTKCRRCNAGELEIPEDAREVLSGATIAVRLPAALRTALTGVYGGERMDAAELSLASTPWDLSPTLLQEPAMNASEGSGDVVPGTLLHSGEMSLAATDLTLKGRGLDFALTRTYRSQTIGSGPLGPGWDHNYDMRLRELPDGSVDLFDGRGRKEHFEKPTNGKFPHPPGRLVNLHRTQAGWAMLDSQHNLFRFDRFGRLIAIADFVKDSPDTGTQVEFAYDLWSRLVRVEALGRELLFTYDSESRLTRVRDFTGREVKYSYDAQGRLEKVTSPVVTKGESTFPNGLTTTYAYPTPSGDLAGKLSSRDNLTSVTDPTAQRWVELTYTDQNGDGRADEVRSQHWGESLVSIDYNFGARTATVLDRRGKTWIYTHDQAGHPVRTEDPKHEATVREYDATGNLTLEVTRGGRQIVQQPRTDLEDPRAWGSLYTSKVLPNVLRGTNGSSDELVTAYLQYDNKTNQPTLIRDPRGQLVRYSPDEKVSLPRITVEAFSSDDAGTTQIGYNNFGQPLESTNQNGHVTRYTYYDSPPLTGYLRQVTVDPGGLNLTTQYEWDFWGNPAAVIDPRGVRNEFVFNELGWMVEQREGIASGGAPLVHRYLYDRNGNVTEEQVSAGDGGESFTHTQYDYGRLNEVTRVRREITPGSFSETSYDYDFNMNRIQQIDPEGQVTQWHYDDRNQVSDIHRGVGTLDEVVETFEYNADGQVSRHTDGEGKVWETTYDGYGRVAKEIDPLGNMRKTRYDDGGNPVSIRNFDAEDTLFSSLGIDYDVRGRRIRERELLFDRNSENGPEPREVARSFTYDRASNLKTITDERSSVTRYDYDAAERNVKAEDALGNRVDLTLDGQGNAIQLTGTEQLSGGGATTTQTTRQFDALGRLTSETDPVGLVSRRVVDVRGNIRLEIDPANLVTEHVYDGLDRALSTTRPDGSTVQIGYDRSSRPTSYRDPLGQTTTYAYDALDRRREIHYPDGTLEHLTYDHRGSLVLRERPTGTQVQSTYDDAGRLTRRQVTPGDGVAGPFEETFTVDPLGRVTHAVSGAIIADRRYDSMSRLTSERVAGRTVGYSYDDAGNRTETRYPSGRTVAIQPDALGRPSTIDVLLGSAQRAAKVSYGYRGKSLVGQKTLGTAISGTIRQDAAGRLFTASYAGLSGHEILKETVLWNASGLKKSVSRGDLNDAGFQYSYDGALRLTEAKRIASQSTGEPLARTVANLPNLFSFSYDGADNLLGKSEQRLCKSDQTALPLDGSGRNRPGSVGGTALAWDLNGNLTGKRDLRYHYDWKDRLTRITRPDGTEVASYEYDAFDRRIAKVVDGERIEAVWDGWEAIEQYKTLQLDERRVYGVGMDELVSLERDPEHDGSFTEYVPYYDESGNLVAVSDALGKVIERYEYSPYGDRWVLVDSTPPVVEQVRVVGNQIWIEMSEEVILDGLTKAMAAGALKLEKVANGETVAIAITQPVLTGVSARKRLVISLTAPADDQPDPGDLLRLTIPAASLRDFFDNTASAGITTTLPWTAHLVQDDAAPRVQRVCLTAGHLEVELSEEPDQSRLAGVVIVDGAPIAWTLSGDHYTLVSTAVLAEGSHSLAIGTTALDLDGRGLAEGFQRTFSVASPAASLLVFSAPLPGLSSGSTIGNLFGFQGLPVDLESGLLYVRNRYYDPELGRFVTADPTEYSDGPNLYAFAGDDPVNFSDPLGLSRTTTHGGTNYFGDPMNEFDLDSDSSGWKVAGVVALDTLGNTLSDALFLDTIADTPHATMDPDLPVGERIWAGLKGAGAIVLALGGEQVVVKAIGGRLLSSKPARWLINKAAHSSVGRRAAEILLKEVKFPWSRAEKAAAESAEKRFARFYAEAERRVAERRAQTRATFGELDPVNMARDAASSQHVNLASPARTQHILHGDATGGGHLWPGRPGKTPFPQGWSEDKIMHYVSDIATDPSIPWVPQTGNGSWFTKKGNPARFMAIGNREGIDIKVIIEPAGEGIITAHPK